MLSLLNRRIFLCLEPMDMRRGIDRLAGWVQGTLRADPFQGDAYVFISRDRRRLKVLIWDQSGYWLAMKRLESGRFAPPRPGPLVDGVRTAVLSQGELALLLEGITVHKATYHAHYHRREAEIPGSSPRIHN